MAPSEQKFLLELLEHEANSRDFIQDFFQFFGSYVDFFWWKTCVLCPEEHPETARLGVAPDEYLSSSPVKEHPQNLSMPFADFVNLDGAKICIEKPDRDFYRELAGFGVDVRLRKLGGTVGFRIVSLEEASKLGVVDFGEVVKAALGQSFFWDGFSRARESLHESSESSLRESPERRLEMKLGLLPISETSVKNLRSRQASRSGS